MSDDWNIEGLSEREVVWIDRFDRILADAEGELDLDDAGTQQGLEATVRLMLQAVLPSLRRLERRGWSGNQDEAESQHRDAILSLITEITRCGKGLPVREQTDKEKPEGG